jgi:hypothetical protein
MRLGSALCVTCSVLLAAGCGGGGPSGPSGLDWAGTINVTSAMTPGNLSCLSTTVVTFKAAGVDVHAVNTAGGGCVEFVNADTTTRRPGPAGATLCPELSGPVLAQGQSFTTAPLDGPRTCQWQDVLHPIPSGGGSGY